MVETVWAAWSPMKARIPTVAAKAIEAVWGLFFCLQKEQAKGGLKHKQNRQARSSAESAHSYFYSTNRRRFEPGGP